jgi:hypothetical protein
VAEAAPLCLAASDRRGDATGIRPFENENMLVNMSV